MGHQVGGLGIPMSPAQVGGLAYQRPRDVSETARALLAPSMIPRSLGKPRHAVRCAACCGCPRIPEVVNALLGAAGAHGRSCSTHDTSHQHA